MQPLDLSAGPPRDPRAELAGITFLPRTIDKARADLPGGNPGDYRMPGFSERMLEILGIDGEAFASEVGRARSDEDVARFVASSTTPEKIAEWNDFILHRLPSGGDRNAAYERYPWLRERPDIILALDVLTEDDRLAFG